MKEDFTERLLDASLKQYSSVEVPEGFAERLAAKKGMGVRGWGIGRRWWWMLAPAAAALAGVLVFWPKPATQVAVLPHPPYSIPQPLVHPPSPIPHPPAPRVARATKPRWRTLTADEIARLDFPDSLLVPAESKEPAEIEVPELEIKPLPEVTDDEQENRPAAVPGAVPAPAGPGKAKGH